MPDLTRGYDFTREIESASGSFLYRRDGRRLLDASSGIWNVNLGHGRTDILQAIGEQLSRLTYLCVGYSRSPVADQLAEAVLRHAPATMSRVMLHCTGTAAVEGAVLLTRQYFKLTGEPKRVGIVGVEGAFHGGSLLGENLSGYPEEPAWFDPIPGGFYHVPAPDGEEAARRNIDALVELIEREGADRMAAFVFEPVMAVAGVIVPPDWWMREVCSVCHHYGLKVIADEVTTGLGRAGKWFACEGAGVDIITLGKGLGAAYMPLAASLYAEEMFEPFNRGEGVPIDFGSTMDGYPAACAAGLAVLRTLEGEGLIARAADMGARLSSRIAGLERSGIVGRIRGRGMMIGVPLIAPGDGGGPMPPRQVKEIMWRLADAGLLVQRGQSTLTVFPPLTLAEDEADLLVAILEEVLGAVGEELSTGGGRRPSPS